MKARKMVDNILGVSPSKIGIRIASGITKGFEEGIKETNSKAEKIISNKFEGLSDELTKIVETELNRGD